MNGDAFGSPRPSRKSTELRPNRFERRIETVALSPKEDPVKIARDSVNSRLIALEDVVYRIEKRMFLSHNEPQPAAARKSSLAQAAHNGDVCTVKILIQHVHPDSVLDKEGRTAMHIAAAKGHTEILRVLLDAGAGKNMGMASLRGWEGERSVPTKPPRRAGTVPPDSLIVVGTVVFQRKLYCFLQCVGYYGNLRYRVFDGASWSEDMNVLVPSGSSEPCLVVYNDKLYCMYREEKLGSLSCGVFDGNDWTELTTQFTEVRKCVSAVAFNGKLFVFYEPTGRQGVSYNVYDGKTWAGEQWMPSAGLLMCPRATEFQGKLYVSYRDAPHFAIMHYRTFDGSKWTTTKHVDIDDQSWKPKAVLVYNGKLYVFHKGANKQDFECHKMAQETWYNVFDGERWAGYRQVPDTWGKYGPTAVVFDGKIYCFHYDDAHLYYNVLYRGKFDGATALHCAAMNGHTSACELLVERGADVEAQTMDGDSALHLAAQQGKQDVVRLLLERGANREAKNTDGRTPKEVADAAVLKAFEPPVAVEQ